MQTYLKQRVADIPHNAYCVDCLRNQATHFELTHAVFICEPCAAIHYHQFKPGKHLIKEIYTEQWDPTQLKILAIASNQEFFEYCRQYMIDQ